MTSTWRRWRLVSISHPPQSASSSASTSAKRARSMLPPDWTRSLPRSIPSFARLPLPGFNTTKALIAGQHKRERRRSLANFRIELLRQGVPDCALDLDGPPHRRQRHHPFVMSRQAGEVAGRRLHRAHKAPIEPKQMDIRDRIALDRPLPAAQPPLGDAEDLFPALDADPTRRVDRRGNERHPRYRLRLGLETSRGPQSRLRKTLGQIVEDRRHFGQPPTVDQQCRHLAFRIDCKIFGAVLLPLGERYSVSMDAPLVNATRQLATAAMVSFMKPSIAAGSVQRNTATISFSGSIQVRL